MATGLALGPAGAGASSVTGLACLPETAQTTELCAALRNVITVDRPGLELALVAADGIDRFPDALRLHVGSLREDGIAARLDWRRAGQEWQRGADMAMQVMDSPLSSAMVHQFLQSLWTQSPAGL